MGKPGGFLDFKRKNAEERHVAARLKDFDPVELRMEEAEVRAQAARCMDCGTPFCHGYGCPLSNVIPEINDLAYRGRWKEAADILISTSNFPEIVARVCPALCEAACVLAIDDDPVAIRQIELAVIETAFEKGYIHPRPPAERVPFSVAVTGSGPAGLAVADTLNRAGHHVTVFDREQEPGGILRYGIPAFKLDKAVLDRRIDLMKAEGVAFETGTDAGRDISYKFLLDRFGAICLAAGSSVPRDISAPGRELGGICFAMDYLRLQNRLLSGEDEAGHAGMTAFGKNVAILGGGDTGSDCLGTALRQNAKHVTQLEIMPEPPETIPASTPWPQWPAIKRSSSSHREGGNRLWAVNTIEFLGKDGHVEKLRCVKVEWRTGPDGRPESFAAIPDSEFDVPSDLVLIAMGFTGPGPNRIVDELLIEKDHAGNIKIDSNHMTSRPGVFSAGDMAHGQSLVVRAIADGRLAAQGIMRYLSSSHSNDEGMTRT